MSKRLFSTGQFFFGPAGTSPVGAAGTPNANGTPYSPATGAFELADVQDVTIEISTNRHDLFDAPVIGVFAVDTADHESKGMVKLSAKDTNLMLEQYSKGAVISSAGGGTNNVSTVNGFSRPQPCAIGFVATDNVTKKTSIFVALNAKPKGQATSFKINDYADDSLEFDTYPDAGNNVMVRTDAN